MAEIDYHKGWIDFLKFVMTALIGLLFVIFWNLMAYPDIVKNMDVSTKIFVFSAAFISILVVLLGMLSWLKILNYLRDA